jgi:nucleoside-diphosphate-sugar epimerase
MNAHDQLHVVLGATGGAGGALVRELAGRDHRVRAVSRRPAAGLPQGVEQLAADAADPAQTRKPARAPRSSTTARSRPTSGGRRSSPR